MVKLRLLAFLPFAVCAACATVLGGLEEGTSREARDAGSDAALVDASSCAWLANFDRRVSLTVRSEVVPLFGHQVRLALDTSALVAAKQVRADLADVRITTSDGTTTVPHWVESGANTAQTTLWTRLDLADRETKAYLYFGDPSATDASSKRDTFVDGVLDDEDFAGTNAWTAYLSRDFGPESSTNQWSTEVADGGARVRYVRGYDPDDDVLGLCQLAYFPAGAAYVLTFDLQVALADRTSATIFLVDPSKDTLFISPRSAIGTWLGAETTAIHPGTQTICLGGRGYGTDVGGGIDATFSRLRVRRVADVEPTVAQSSQIERRCR
jgi:hypothetical protein